MPVDSRNRLNSHDGTLEPWDELAQGEPDHRRVFTVRSDRVKSRMSGREFTVDRLVAPDWVNIVALTERDELVLVRQWRFGARAFTVELPAGLLEKDEDPVAGALRELLEETGYAPERREDVRIIGSCAPNPAFMNNTCHTVFAPRVVKVAAQNLDEMEEVQMLLASREDVERMLADGSLRTALGLVGLYFWLRAERG
jgi:ADP-ribose pyrophosphatase